MPFHSVGLQFPFAHPHGPEHPLAVRTIHCGVNVESHGIRAIVPLLNVRLEVVISVAPVRKVFHDLKHQPPAVLLAVNREPLLVHSNTAHVGILLGDAGEPGCGVYILVDPSTKDRYVD